MLPEEAGSPPIGAALVVGGGIGGMQAALDLATAGIKVYLVEKGPAVGGKMSQLDKTFPTLDCAMCTMAPRLVDLGGSKDIEILTMSEVESLEGEAGHFVATVKKQPRYVDESRCTGCGACVASCPTHNFVALADQETVELEPQYKATVEGILDRNRHRDGPLMPILQQINDAFNYFPESVLRYVARETGYPLTHLLRIATFYGAFSVVPRGRTVIRVCMGTACYVRGGGRILEKFSDTLALEPGQTSSDLQYTLDSLRCLGCCGLAPAVAIGTEVVGHITAAAVPGVVDKYTKE